MGNNVTLFGEVLCFYLCFLHFIIISFIFIKERLG